MILTKTEWGLLEGRIRDGLAVFNGIPYAAPPVGELRFAPAADPLPWDGIRKAYEIGPDCLQTMYGQNIPYIIGGTSEDCLYLNVKTPAPLLREGDDLIPDSSAGLPVYIFLHGGAYEVGGTSMPVLNGDRFAKKGIVFVNLNYRLSVFNAMTLDTLKDEYGKTGGCAATDVLKALEWVGRNIAAFGGDPDNVTLGGESAGAFLVSIMMHTEAAGRLFKRCILESGSARGCAVRVRYGSGNYSFMHRQSMKVLSDLKVDDSPDGLEMLRAIPAEQLLLSWNFDRDWRLRGLFAEPVLEGNVFDGDELPDPRRGIAKVDLLFGFNTDEGSMFAPMIDDEKGYHRWLRGCFPKLWEEVAQKYPLDEEHSAYERIADIIGLCSFKSSMIPYADALADAGCRVYGYHFDYLTELMERQGFGVRHIIETNFVFGHHLYEAGADNEAGRELSECMNDAWAGFIKNGVPVTVKGNEALQWPLYDTEKRMVMRFDEKLSAGPAERMDELLYFRDIIDREYGNSER